MSSKKEECLKEIEEVKASHLQLMESIDLAISGIDTDYFEPLDKHECKFGKWFYNNELAKVILGLQAYERLEQIHAQWHQIYAKIFHLLFPKKNGILKKLLKSKPQPQDIDRAKAYYDDLKELTNNLIHDLEIAKKRAQALNDSKFH
ncbi:Methyl-accepting chemotaxis protein [hydrothermal vent metagenome]|uniref:Methyl-accepting chemotaxis protein n=1 Tax=hydrothermal vent metagenome TaxID=652676 RepID=A0A1W1C4B0_9ZZZZ